MLTPQLPTEVPTLLRQVETAPIENNIELLNRPDVLEAVKEFMLRRLVNRVIQSNEEKSILTDVTIRDMKKNETILGHNEDTEHFAASVNKVPVTMLVLEELRAGRITLDTQLTWQESDRRGGAGVYDQPGSVLQASVREVLEDLLRRSGNTAVRILVNGTLGGATATNNRLALVPQLAHTRLIPLDGNRFYLGNTTSKEALFALNKVIEGNDAYQKVVKDFLTHNIYDDIGAKSQLAGNDYIVLATKHGLLDDSDGDNRHDTGIIYNTRTHKTYGYAVLTTAPSGAGVTGVAEQSLKDIGRYDLRFAGDKPHRTEGLTTPFAAPKIAPEKGKILY